ncbi:DUF2505 domain-containing protein [Pseudonocardia sp. CA-107938]|uniref:DUF2505 domain-containing protein n=1 Tax=Pseudonocardia sp. CA-107938 TaxID=3240021 RepID=UPI003D90DDD3
MASRVRVDTTFAAPPDVLAAEVFGEPFHRAKLAAIGGPGAVLESFEQVSDDELRVALRQVLVRESLPAIARPFAFSDLTLRRHEEWTSDGALPTCRFTTSVAGAPLHGRGTVAFAADPAGTRVTIDVTARITIPFVGRAVQGVVTEVTKALADDELRFAQEWFSDHS